MDPHGRLIIADEDGNQTFKGKTFDELGVGLADSETVKEHLKAASPEAYGNRQMRRAEERRLRRLPAQST